MKRRQHIASLVIVALLVVAVPTIAQTTDQTTVEQQFATAAADLLDQLDQALYLAITGFSAYDAKDQLVAAQRLVNLLEGPAGYEYDGSVGETEGPGILLNPVADNSTDWSSLADTLSSSQIYLWRDALVDMPAFLRLALQASIDALDKAQYYSLSKSTEAFRAAYAYLIAARGGLDDPFLVAGAADLARLFPANSQTVSATQTNENELQTLISSTPAGGIIRLNEGVYRVRAVLTHDVTIQGVLPDDTILQGLAWDAVLAIASEELVHVTLKDLTIQGGESGVAAWTHSENGSIDLTLDNVTLEDNGTAVIAATQTNLEATGCRFVDNKLGIRSNTDDEEVLVRLANCTFDGNESALYAYGSQTVTLENCQILNGTDADGDIVVSNAARLDMRDCEIHRVTGRGIVLANTASMALIDSVIETADSPAIAVASTHRDTSGRVVTDCGISLGPTDSDLPLGTVTGYGNSITGGVCPTILEFLTDPNPDAQ